MKKVVTKSPTSPKTVVVTPGPRVGTREYRDAQRAEFDAKFEAQKKRMAK